MTTPDALAQAPWTIWAIVLPLAAATLVFVIGRRAAATVGLLASAGTGLTAAALAWQVWRLGPQRHPIGGWGAPLGIELYADGLAALMLVMTAVVGVPVAVYARGYFDLHSAGEHAAAGAPAGERQSFWTLWLFLWASMNALFLSADIFNLYVALELVTLSAVALVALNGGVAIAAALRYLLAALLGSLLYLLAVALLYWSEGTLDLFRIGQTLAPGPLAGTALTLATLGLFLKTALVPMHFWLPPAHANAPAPVSAVLSGLVVKASYYLLLRLWFDAFGGVIVPGAAGIVGALGVAAILWGSLQALFARRLKLLVAYSTVAQLGYLFLVFPLVLSHAGSMAWHAGALYALSHACAKSALFLAAGSVLHALGHDRLDGLRGIGSRLPMPVLTIGLTSVALMGLPPSGTFVAKWLMLEVALGGGYGVLAAVTVVGGLLAAGYLFRVLGPAMSWPPADTSALRPIPRVMNWSALLLALVAVLLGVAANPALTLLDVQLPAALLSGSEPVQ